MDRDELAKLSPYILADKLLFFGHIIRSLDEGCEWLEYWTQDGEYINDIAFATNVKRTQLDIDEVRKLWESGEGMINNPIKQKGE